MSVYHFRSQSICYLLALSCIFFSYELTTKEKNTMRIRKTHGMHQKYTNESESNIYKSFLFSTKCCFSPRREIRITKHAKQLQPFSPSLILPLAMDRLGEWALERYARTLSSPSATGKDWETLDSSAKQPLILILTKVILRLIFGMTFDKV